MNHGLKLVVPIVGLLAAGASANAATGPVGHVESVTGAVLAVHADGTEGRLAAGSTVHQGDRLRTGDGSGVGIVFADVTLLALAGNGELTLDEVVFDPNTQTGSLQISVPEGMVVIVSGLIAKADPDGITIVTPSAVVGVRGTQFGLIVGDRTTAVLMEESDAFVGEIVVKNRYAAVVLNLAHAATSVPSSGAWTFPVFDFDPRQVGARFGPALRHLPKDRTSANRYGTAP